MSTPGRHVASSGSQHPSGQLHDWPNEVGRPRRPPSGCRRRSVDRGQSSPTRPNDAMTNAWPAAVLLAALSFRLGGQSTELKRGLVITKSVRITPKSYRLGAPLSLDSAVVVIRGEDITVDFAGATLVGADPETDPDRTGGVGIRIEGGRNVVIRNATVRGYKVGLIARGTRGLT